MRFIRNGSKYIFILKKHKNLAKIGKNPDFTDFYQKKSV